MTPGSVCEFQLFGTRKTDEHNFSAPACELSFSNICVENGQCLCFKFFHINPLTCVFYLKFVRLLLFFYFFVSQQ